MAGRQKLQTRALRHKVTPAIQPGTLDGSEEHIQKEKGHGSPLAKHFAHKIRQICEFSREKPMPRFKRDTRHLDGWLQAAMMEERTNFLSAFIDQGSMIQANRPYRLIGPKNLVSVVTEMLHMSEGGEGFRKLLKLTALNYYTSNFGGAVYLNRTEPVTPTYLPHIDAWDWQLPAVNQMFATDPTLFTPRDDYVYPVEYDGTPWTRYDFFRIVSMPSTMMPTWGVGRCPLYRCIQIARMTSAIYDYIFDVVAPDTAKGIVTIKGMSWEEFLEAMTGSEAVNEQDTVRTNGFIPGLDDLNDILVLADRDNEITVRFTQLGRIPEGFFLDSWVRWTLTSFAVNVGFPLDEFIGSTSDRLLGSSAQEIESGERRGGSKGGAEFINQFEEMLQQLVMPRTVSFEFAERDASADLADMALIKEWSSIVTQLFQASQLIELDEALSEIEREARRQSQRIINAAEARRLLVEKGVLPDWIQWNQAEINDYSQSIDTSKIKLEMWRNWAREKPAILRLAARPLGQPIVMYEQAVNQNTGRVNTREVTLWDDDSELSRASKWPGYSPERDGSGILRTNSMAHDWGERNLKKAPRLEHALKSDHTDNLARTIRRYYLGEIELTREVKDAIASRLYAMAQIGRDAVLGRGRPDETVMAQIAGQLVDWGQKYATGLCHHCLEGEAPPTPDRVPTGTAAYPLQRSKEEFMQSASIWATDEEALSGAVREEARNIANDLAGRSFAAGQYATAQNTDDFRQKTWIAGDQVHGSLDGSSAALDEDFAPGYFWPGMSAGCRCEAVLRGQA